MCPPRQFLVASHINSAMEVRARAEDVCGAYWILNFADSVAAEKVKCSGSDGILVTPERKQNCHETACGALACFCFG